MKKIIIVLLLSIVNCQLSICQIGTWRNYLAYYDVQQIQEAGNDLFVLASNDLYQYNKQDQSIRTYDKTNGLSDTHITHIRWCQQAKRLIAVYQNSNIDIIDTNGNVINISSLYTKSIVGDKTVNSVTIDGIYAFLFCGFGIVQIDMKQAVILYTHSHEEYPTNLPDEENNDYDKYIEIVKKLNPGGPKYNYFNNMLMHNGSLYTVGGGWYQFDNFFRPGTIQIMDKNKDWTIYQDDIQPAFASEYKDVNSIAIDPLNEGHVMVASCSGLYEFQDSKFKYNYTEGNTEYFMSATHDGNPNYVRTDGIIYDKEGNLYCLNSASKTAIIKRSIDGKWSGFMDKTLIDKPDYSMRVMKGSMIDSRGLMWFVNAHSDHPSFFCYDYQSNKIIRYDNFTNEDGVGLGNSWAECICEDKDGNIWVGTDKGPVYLTSAELANPSLGVIQYKVPRNDGSEYADYLLAGIDITSIAIDGAGRKWFGTNGNGVYLISVDNNQQVHHFTTTNSPLLSDYIESIVINHQTGEVFFGTNQGLCSYFSDATEPSNEMTEDNVYAYPNPVNPNYTGPITITGLSFNADVKIVSANGLLIHQGRSNGGTFTWDGCDKKGNRVASGIYMVITATSNGSKGVVTKIAIIR